METAFLQQVEGLLEIAQNDIRNKRGYIKIAQDNIKEYKSFIEKHEEWLEDSKRYVENYEKTYTEENSCIKEKGLENIIGEGYEVFWFYSDL